MTVLPEGLDPPVDESTAPWWAATRDRRLVAQHCSACGHWQHYPRPVCLRCGGPQPGFETVSGRGVVDTWTTVHRSPDGREVPYAVARVRLDEGPVLLSVLVDAAGRDDLIDAPVGVDWFPLPDGRHLPVFRLT